MSGSKAKNLALLGANVDATGEVDSNTIDGIDSAQFLRSDQSDTMTGGLTIRNSDFENVLKLNRDLDVATVGAAGLKLKFGAVYQGADVYPVDITGIVDNDGTAERLIIGMDGNNLVTVRNNGYVGINTENPNYYLQVNGGIGVRNGSFYVGDDTGTNVGGIELYKPAGQHVLRVYSNPGAFGGTYSAVDTSIDVYGGSTYSTRIQGSGDSFFGGRLGIGTGSAPGRPLSVQSSTGSRQGIEIYKPNLGRSFYNCYSMMTGAGSTLYAHIKTNVTMGYTMFRADFNGYNYGTTAAINCSCGGYAYEPTNSIIAQYSTTDYGSASVSMYKSADGYLVFAVYVGGSSYYAGFHMDMHFEQPTGQTYDLEILDAAWSASSSYF